jgi:hypothetical protein
MAERAASGSNYPSHAAGIINPIREKVYEFMGTVDAPV